jgi:hypothetical protein
VNRSLYTLPFSAWVAGYTATGIRTPAPIPLGAIHEAV